MMLSSKHTHILAHVVIGYLLASHCFISIILSRFQISLEELLEGEDIAPCPSCTLRIKVIYDMEALPKLVEEEEPEEIEKSES